MSIVLSDDTQALIEERMKLGRYTTADDIVRVALDVLRQIEDEPVDEAEAADIRLSREQVRRGEVIDWQTASDALFGLSTAAEHPRG